jgi:hypothetical protein
VVTTTPTTTRKEKYLKYWPPLFMPAAKGSARTSLGPMFVYQEVAVSQKGGRVEGKSDMIVRDVMLTCLSASTMVTIWWDSQLSVGQLSLTVLSSPT